MDRKEIMDLLVDAESSLVEASAALIAASDGMKKASENHRKIVEIVTGQQIVFEKASSPVSVKEVDILRTPDEIRRHLVMKAKKDLESLGENREDLKSVRGLYAVQAIYEGESAYCNSEFIINREKRTVVCLLKGYNTGIIRAKGKAKCAPTDCFNEHLGKAIALYKALGQPVPKWYWEVPNPEFPEVGDIVTGIHENEGFYYNQARNFTLTKKNTNNSFKYKERPTDWIYESNIGRIIDDSNRK